MTRLPTLAIACALLLGCGGSPPPGASESETASPSESRAAAESPAASAPSSLPERMLIVHGTGPALFFSEAADAPAVGFVTAGVPAVLRGSPREGRIEAKIDGPLTARGWVSLGRLGLRAQQRGRVDGAPAYLGPNDLVTFRGTEANGMTRIAVWPQLGSDRSVGPFDGTFATDKLAFAEVDAAAVPGPSSGEEHTLPAGQEVQLFDRPGGAVVATIPAMDQPARAVVLRDQGEWKGVRVGSGPYLIGYTNAALGSATELSLVGRGEIASRLVAETNRPLLRVREGARLKFAGKVIGIFKEQGYCREMNRYDNGDVDCYVAVNDDLAMRGLLRTDDLEAVNPPPAPEPAAPVPTSTDEEF